LLDSCVVGALAPSCIAGAGCCATAGGAGFGCSWTAVQATIQIANSNAAIDPIT